MYIELTIESGRYIATIYSKYGEDMIPFLVTAGCNRKDLYADSYKMLQDIYEEMYKEKVRLTPMLPYVCDIVLPTLPPSEFVKYIWVAEFCERLGMELKKY